MSTTGTSRPLRRQVVAALGISVVLLGIVVLLSWAARRWQVLTFGPGLVPTAPSTAMLFVLLGCALLVRARWPDDARADRLGVGLSLAVLLLALGVGATPTLGPVVPLEDWLGPPAERVGGLLVGRMSPMTALAFVASTVALLLRRPRFAGRDALRVLAGVFATSVALLAGVLLIGYAAGAPALYGSDIVPMAVPTALAFLLSGIAILVLCFREPLPSESSSDERARAVAAVVFVAFVAVVAIAAVLLLRMQLADARRGIVAELNLIADQKVQSIADWRNERLSDGSYVSRAPAVAQDVAALLRDPSSATARAGLTRWTALLGNGKRYAHVYVFDLRRGIRLVFSSDSMPATAGMMAQVAAAAKAKDVNLTSIYRGSDGHAHLSVLVRHDALKRSEARGNRGLGAPTAVVALEVDVGRDLYPSMHQWPTRTSTAEILLVEREGRDVVFITQPRYGSKSPLPLRRSLAETDLPAVRAALGAYDAADGVDYRGSAVLAVARAVPGSPWKLLAKVDHVEIYAPLRQRALVSGIALAGFAVIAGLALAALWRARELTARAEADERLRESEERFAQAFHSSPVGTFISTLDGTYVDANQALCELVGCARADLIGHRVGVLGNATDTLRDHVIAEAAGAGGTLRGIEHSIRHLDGSSRNIVFSTTIIELHGVPHRLSTCQDVTQRKQAEAAVKLINDELEHRIAERTAQLQASNKELEAFAYSVSHDLRAPLRAVDGYMSILQEQYGEQWDDEGRRICGIVRQSAQDLGRLIDELLEYSRIGRTEVRRARVDMEALARTVFQEVTTGAARSRITFTVGELPAVDGDAVLLRKLWMNLLDNAIKFSSRQSQAVIEVGCVHGEHAAATGGGAAGPNTAVFFVRDNGAGFDMRYVGKLFGMFERLHAEREFPGTGVGLAIVQRIVQRHAGQAWAEGVPGAGATFYFSLGGGA